MILTEKKFRAERGGVYKYQGFTATLEIEVDRHYLTIQLDNLTRWRSKEEYAEYLRWAADEIESLDIPQETRKSSRAIEPRSRKAWK